MIEFVIASSLLVGSSRALKYLRKNGDKIFLFCSFLIFLLLSALRHYSIGSDTREYTLIFTEISTTQGIVFSDGRFESGYVLFNSVLGKISSDPQFFLAVTSVIIFSIFYFFIKGNSKNYFIAVLVFFLCGFFKFSLSAIRQLLAICLLILGFSCLKKKKFFLYFLFGVIAFFFHKSSVLAFVLLFVALFKWKKPTFILLLILSIVSIILVPVLLSGNLGYFLNYGRYIDSAYDSGISLASFALLLISFLETYLIWSATAKEDNNIYLRISFLKTLILLVAIRLNAIDRIAEYFTIFTIVGISNAVIKLSPNKRTAVVSGIILLYFSYSLIWGIFRPEYQQIWPFKFFWQ